jgi:integrase/recombinase XerD
MVAVQRVGSGADVTWTVVGDDHLPVGPVEEFLEFMRVAREASPHTVRSYATALAGLWSYVGQAGLSWDDLSLPELTGYLRALRTGQEDGVRRLDVPGSAEHCRTDRTVATRWAAVGSFYRYHAEVHQVPVGEKLYRSGPRSRRSRYVPALAHTHRGARQVPVVRVRQGDGRPVPLLNPAQVAAILDVCARFDPASGSWVGSVRDRLLFATLAETGLRLGECLSLRHRDWHLGQGSTPFVEVVPTRDHPHQMRAKGGRSRRVYVSDDLERLYGEYLWSLVDAGAADELEDLEGHWVFVNLSRGQRFSPLRPESVYSKVRAIKAHLGPAVPAEWSPHWFRHSHASALLLRGTPAHVVMRRLGHADIQTTLSLYGWVTEDAELRALAGWQSLCPKGASAGE